MKDPERKSDSRAEKEVVVSPNRVTQKIRSEVLVVTRGFLTVLVALSAFFSACATTAGVPGPEAEQAEPSQGETKGIPYSPSSRRDGSMATQDDGSPGLADADDSGQPDQNGSDAATDGAFSPAPDGGVDARPRDDADAGVDSGEPTTEAGRDGDCEPLACWSEGGVTRVCTAEGAILDCGNYACELGGYWDPAAHDCQSDVEACEPFACWSEGGVTRVCTAEGEQLACGVYRCTVEGRWDPDEEDCSGDEL